ncbi:hypothetical protein J7T55_006891 [Diaporthe amygdali]|uniref:uncharacterized protein n=1 Tax=Phomopsis amygdali TaxID=1214568 RepID=UPI0022FE9CD6|nr:uncharacterized protein J7T55_006891 [Diaporthe amygdali]KAJ0107013.1 hypothetical protein J7T55_006891 [Diaporthe amygdali]
MMAPHIHQYRVVWTNDLNCSKRVESTSRWKRIKESNDPNSRDANGPSGPPRTSRAPDPEARTPARPSQAEIRLPNFTGNTSYQSAAYHV